jgi:hypothetical protein
MLFLSWLFSIAGKNLLKNEIFISGCPTFARE